MQQQPLYKFLISIFIIACVYYCFLIQNKNNDCNINNQLKIVCTTTIIADAVQNIAKNTVNITTLMNSGVDPHTYKPVEQDILAIAQADIIFYHGLHLEARMSDLFDDMKEYKTVIAVSATIPEHNLIFDTNFKQYADPHIWLDPTLWCYAVAMITQHLQKLNAAHAQEYEINKNEYLKKIMNMHQKNITFINHIPKHERILITGHDAFSYFARIYNFQVFSLQGINTASQAGTKDVQNLIQIIVTKKIKTIFPENSIPIRNIQSLMQSASAQGQSVNIGQELFADSLGPLNTTQDSYIGMMHSNVINIVHGLQ